MTGQTGLTDSLIVEVDAECWGTFQTLEQAADQNGVYVLKEGWIRKGFLEIWWGEDTGDPEALTPGRHVRDADNCNSHAVTISQRFGTGLRQREQSWTLINACPVAWEIKEEGADGEKLRLTELTVVASDIGVAR